MKYDFLLGMILGSALTVASYLMWFLYEVTK